MRIHIVRCNDGSFPRYVIQGTNGLTWTGSGWSEEPDKAMTYASQDQAQCDCEKLQASLDSEDTIHLEATISIQIRHHDQFDLDAFRWFMAEASRFLLDYEQPRPPGLEEAIISSSIFWNSMRKV